MRLNRIMTLASLALLGMAAPVNALRTVEPVELPVEALETIESISEFVEVESIDEFGALEAMEASGQQQMVMEYDTVRTREEVKDYLEFNFRFDKYDLDMDYKQNSAIMSRFEHLIDSIGIDNISKIEIVSQSSPEGVYEHNMWLSDKRSATMDAFMREHYPDLVHKMTVSPDGESWQMLRDYVSRDTRMEAAPVQRVLDVIDADINVGTRKWRMENVLGTDANVGDVYRYLYRTYYPVIRFSGITIDHETERVQINERPVVVPVVEPVIPVEQITEAPVEVEPEPEYRRFPKLALKTNLAYDAVFTKNLGYSPILNVEYEYYLSENGHWSTVGEYEFPWWSNEGKHQYLQMFNWQQEVRYYLKKGKGYTGHYLSAYAGANIYDICFDSKLGNGYQGEGVHAGLGYGYVLPLNRKGSWKLEFFLKGGYYESHYDKYDAGIPFQGKYYYRWYKNPNDFVPRNWRFRWFGPTGAGITLSYDIIYRRKLNK